MDFGLALIGCHFKENLKRNSRSRNLRCIETMLDIGIWAEVFVAQKTSQDIQIQCAAIKQIFPIHLVKQQTFCICNVERSWAKLLSTILCLVVVVVLTVAVPLGSSVNRQIAMRNFIFSSIVSTLLNQVFQLFFPAWVFYCLVIWLFQHLLSIS